ncbi:serine/threonine-protein kinase NIM1-like isoform X2 [Xenia sp. Carnegie-2017]|uniref:serine/threonine-protein kinase NIM1-like isoform X2 n=1 Tax=Xenia sp. Carnegie-2017 TaxID=2897299 RepID=UPI001F04FDD2|nr:serine/threonine-protein kinase NIM1-like isoform X2 [Xenia sp. Carnegie-2017]
MTTDSPVTKAVAQIENTKLKVQTPYEKVCDNINNDEGYAQDLAQGKRIGFYSLREDLGSGNFSRVKMGVHTLTKDKVAVKIYNKLKLDAKTQRFLSREISSMEKLHHPNTVRLYEVIETFSKLYLIMEFANGGELSSKISTEGKLSQKTTKRIFCQIVAALDHMHKKNIIHRDLKAENVFISGLCVVKVGDFGFSTCASFDTALTTFCGSPPYAAPELFKDDYYLGPYVDIWALGILLYFMVTGVMPFRAETVGKLKKSILNGLYIMPDFLPDNCKYLIRKILQLIPKNRFTLEQIKRCKWLQGETFPLDEASCNTHPPNIDLCNEEELEARCCLEELGVPLDNGTNTTMDVRSKITGTYRIVLHRKQKEKSELDIKNTKSKVCTIL